MVPQLANELLLITSFLWAGMILGISFLEAWAKFQASSLSRNVGLDVGQTVFGYFQCLQFSFNLFIIILMVFATLSFTDYLLILLISTCLVLQMLWLFPVLKKRAQSIIAGISPPASSVHLWYGIIEFLKLISLIILGVLLLHSYLN